MFLRCDRLDIVLSGRVGRCFHRFNREVQRRFPLSNSVRLRRRSHYRGSNGRLYRRHGRILVRILFVSVVLSSSYRLVMIGGCRAIGVRRLITMYRGSLNGRPRSDLTDRRNGGVARGVAPLMTRRHGGSVGRISVLSGISAVRGICYRVRPSIDRHGMTHSWQSDRVLGNPLRRGHRGSRRRNDRNFARRAGRVALPLHRLRLARGFSPVGMIGRESGDRWKVVRVSSRNRRLLRSIRGIRYLHRVSFRIGAVVRHRFTRLITGGTVSISVSGTSRFCSRRRTGHRHLLNICLALRSTGLRVVVRLSVRRLGTFLEGMIRRLRRQPVRIRVPTGIRLIMLRRNGKVVRMRGGGGRWWWWISR